jgi:hypothetical protein
LQMRRCDNGHYFDSDKHYQCPYCLNAGGGQEKTRAMMQNTVEPGKTQPLKGRDEQATVGVLSKSSKIEPVTGWLVSIDGPTKGQDYRIRSEKNFIGRSEKMDICISGDEKISRENHAIISYDPKNNVFRIYPGDSKGLVYLNDQEVIIPSELKQGDQIELGQTRLKFVPFCGESFQWK